MLAAMVKQILFVQGAGPDVHDGWDNWLADDLQRQLGNGYVVRYPRMPGEADPHYAAWKSALLGELKAMGDAAILVGHSVGAMILLHALAEHAPAPHIEGVFLLAAPFIGEDGWPSDEIEPRTAFLERLGPELPVFVYHARQDEIVPFQHASLYAKAIPQAVLRVVEGGDHQFGNDMSAVARDIRSLA